MKKLSLRVLLPFTAIFSLYYIFFVYQDNFINGELNASSFIINFFKLIFIIWFYLQLLICFRPIIQYQKLFSFILLFTLPLLYFLIKFFIGINDFLIFNYLIFVPIIFLNYDNSTILFNKLTWIVFFQIIIDLIIHNYFDLSLWSNNAFVGGLGNPSTFGITCCLCLLFSLNFHKNSNKYFILRLILVVGGFLTQSMLTFIWMPLILIFMRPRFFVPFLVLTLLSFFAFYNNIDDLNFHVLYKIRSLFNDGIFDNINSYSILNRVDWFNNHIYRIKSGELSLLYGDIGDYGFISGDSQFLGILSLGGFPLLFGFLFFLFFSFLNYRGCKRSRSEFKLRIISFSILFSFFSFNRALEYFPFALVFFLWTNIIKSSFSNSQTSVSSSV